MSESVPFDLTTRHGDAPVNLFRLFKNELSPVEKDRAITKSEFARYGKLIAEELIALPRNLWNLPSQLKENPRSGAPILASITVAGGLDIALVATVGATVPLAAVVIGVGAVTGAGVRTAIVWHHMNQMTPEQKADLDAANPNWRKDALKDAFVVGLGLGTVLSTTTVALVTGVDAAANAGANVINPATVHQMPSLQSGTIPPQSITLPSYCSVKANGMLDPNCTHSMYVYVPKGGHHDPCPPAGIHLIHSQGGGGGGIVVIVGNSNGITQTSSSGNGGITVITGTSGSTSGSNGITLAGSSSGGGITVGGTTSTTIDPSWAHSPPPHGWNGEWNGMDCKNGVPVHPHQDTYISHWSPKNPPPIGWKGAWHRSSDGTSGTHARVHGGKGSHATRPHGHGAHGHSGGSHHSR
jgi:hypothetical protein